MRKIVSKPVALNWFSLLLAATVNTFIVHYFPLFDLSSRHSLRPVMTSWTLILIMLVMTRYISSTISAIILVTLCSVTLSIANYEKFSKTNSILTANDIVHLDNIHISMHYVSIYVIISALLIVGFVLFDTVRTARKNGRKYRFIVFATIFYCLFTFDLSHARQSIVSYLNGAGITYYSWSHQSNVKENGIFIHLLQTSARKKPAALTSDELADMRKNMHFSMTGIKTPQKFIMILCEACWFDDRHFRQVFEPLFGLGGSPFRAISPVYGGGTPNASFEIMTGLPARNPALYGVIYQEYKDFFARRVSSLPTHLTDMGYVTLSMHNYNSTMWSRAHVEPRLGFNDFIGIERMKKPDSSYWLPRDFVLFDAAYDEFLKHPDDRLFLHLATVHTHGPYPEKDGDGGIQDYQNRLSLSIEDLAHFVEAIRSRAGDTVILIYADHKPALRMFAGMTDPAKSGDVPIIIFDNNEKRKEALVKHSDGKPFYCLSRNIGALYFDMQLAAHYYAADSCTHFSGKQYLKLAASLPESLYTASLHYDAEQAPSQ